MSTLTGIEVGKLGRPEWFYPDLTLAEAIDLVRRIFEVGGHISRSGLAKLEKIDPRGAGLASRVNDLTAYGLVKENDELEVTPLAQEIIQGYAAKAWDAFLSVPLYAKLHERLKGKEPLDKVVLENILYEITKADSDSISRRAMRLKNNYMEALSYFSGGTPMDTKGAMPPSPQPTQHLGLVTIPRDYATEVTDSFIIGVKKDIESMELLEDWVKSWVALWKKQIGTKPKSRPESPDEK